MSNFKYVGRTSDNRLVVESDRDKDLDYSYVEGDKVLVVMTEEFALFLADTVNFHND